MDPVSAPLAELPSDAEAALTDGDFSGGDTVLGQTVYTEACESCHGPTGEGGHNGIPLRDTLTPERIFATVTRGRNDMPSFADALDAEQIRAVTAYVRMMLEGR